MNILTISEIEQLIPSAFTQETKSGISKKYNHYTTANIIERLAEHDFYPIQAEELKVRKVDNGGFQKHMIRFRNPHIEFQLQDKNNTKLLIEIIVTNSHDGKNAFRLNLGFYNTYNDTHLLVKSDELGQIKISHIGYNSDTLDNDIKNLIDSVEPVLEKIDEMVVTNLSLDTKIKYVLETQRYRWMEKRDKQINEELLIYPDNVDDKSDDLWTLFNLVHKKLSEGGEFTITGRKTRRINNFSQLMKFSGNLWNLTERYL